MVLYPGDVERDSSRGCNLLIRDGAHPVLDASDLIEELSLVMGPPRGLRASPGGEADELMDLITSYREQFDQDFLSSFEDRQVLRKDLMVALNLSSDEKYKFICMPDARQKETFLEGQLRYLSMIRKQEALLGDDFGLN